MKKSKPTKVLFIFLSKTFFLQYIGRNFQIQMEKILVIITNDFFIF